MFRKKKPKIVGATDKLAVARQMRELTRADILRKSGASRSHSQAVPVTIVFAMAVILALFLTDAGMLSRWGRPTGVYEVDRLLVGSTIPHFTDDSDMNRLIVVFIRGAAFFFFTGLLPFAAFLLTRTLFDKNRVNPLVVCWGVSVGVPLFYLLTKDTLSPILKQLLGGF